MAPPKGKSNNPSGRPKGSAGLSRFIRAQTRGCRELAEIALRVARGEASVPTPCGKDNEIVDVYPTHREVLAAVAYLTERALGKAVETVVTHEGQGNPLADVSTEELKELAKLNATQH